MRMQRLHAWACSLVAVVRTLCAGPWPACYYDILKLWLAIPGLEQALWLSESLGRHWHAVVLGLCCTHSRPCVVKE